MHYVSNSLIVGGMGALASALVAALCGRIERGKADPPLNAISHIAWGGAPPMRPGKGGVNTAMGIALHVGASVWWAAWFEALFGRVGRRSVPSTVASSTAVAAAAYVTDYYVVSKRFRPGFEAYLSNRSLFAIYAALAAGIAIGARLTRFNDHQIKNRKEGDKGGHAERSPNDVVAPESRR